jgi:glyoxylase-like metal-dependent hydrolase (beta-lactamase superfamily II)
LLLLYVFNWRMKIDFCYVIGFYATRFRERVTEGKSLMNKPQAIFLPSIVFLLGMFCFQAGAHARSLPGLTEVAPNAYAVIGKTEEPTPSNHGVVGNYGVIVAEDGVILVDTGTSKWYAQQLLEDIRTRFGKPVILAINTHQGPAFVFGNGTLAARSVPILAHKETDALIAQRCSRCLKLLHKALGPEEMEGTEVVRPTMTVGGSTTIAAGGRVLDILYYGQTSAPGSIAVYDRASGVLFGGGMISIDRIPDIKDADISQWRQALKRLQAIEPVKVVPGEGPVVEPARIDELDRYLSSLADTVRDVYQQGASLTEAAPLAQLSAFQSWGLYDTLHRKNVEQMYLRLERAALARE